MAKYDNFYRKPQDAIARFWDNSTRQWLTVEQFRTLVNDGEATEAWPA